jgi:hypothetical protein
MVKWEYAVIPLATELREVGLETQQDLLNKYGVQGWELVSTTLVKVGNAFDIIAYLKRERK